MDDNDLIRIKMEDQAVGRLLDQINRKNCGPKVRELRESFGNISREDLAKVLGVSRTTIMRIEEGRTLPSDEFLNRLKALQELGVATWKRLSEQDKTRFTKLMEDLGEDRRAVAEAFKSEATRGLSVGGILTGLGTIGMLVSGIRASAALPFSLILGYGVARGLKAIMDANNLKCTEIDGRWEIVRVGQSTTEPNSEEDKDATR